MNWFGIFFLFLLTILGGLPRAEASPSAKADREREISIIFSTSVYGEIDPCG
jgi:hypothetical protein